MSDWTNSHDLVYAFVCVSFLADGDVDESEKEAMRGNVKVMLPDMGDDEYHQLKKKLLINLLPSAMKLLVLINMVLHSVQSKKCFLLMMIVIR